MFTLLHLAQRTQNSAVSYVNVLEVKISDRGTGAAIAVYQILFSPPRHLTV
jgi:hypothetical protein